MSLQKYEIDQEELVAILNKINNENENSFAKVHKSEDGLTDVVKVVSNSGKCTRRVLERITQDLENYK